MEMYHYSQNRILIIFKISIFLKVFYNFYVRQNMEVLWEDTGQMLHDVGFGDDFFHFTVNA
jgi:hypothetical protein